MSDTERGPEQPHRSNEQLRESMQRRSMTSHKHNKDPSHLRQLSHNVPEMDDVHATF